MAEATIWKTEVRGETLFHARVQLPGPRGPIRAFRIGDQPSQRFACLAVLEWAQRAGKQVCWQYVERLK